MEGHDGAQTRVSPNDGAQVPRPVGHVLSGVHGGAGIPDVVRNVLRPPTARRPRPTSAPGSVPGSRPAESGPTAAAGCRPILTQQGHAPTWPAALSNASEATGSSRRRADEPATPCRAATWPAAPAHARRGEPCHAIPRTSRQTRAASLCGSPARGRGRHSVTARSYGTVVSRSLHRFHLVRLRPGMRAVPVRGQRPTPRGLSIGHFGRLDNPRRAEQHGFVGRCGDRGSLENGGAASLRAPGATDPERSHSNEPR